MILQIIRRCVQALAICLVIAIALLSLYGHYRAAHVVHDDELMAGLRGEVLVRWIDPVVSRCEDPDAFVTENKGTLWSLRVFGADVTDPLAAAEVLATSRTLHWALLASIVIPVLVTLLLGRVFCSWICPGYVLFELAGKARKLLKLADLPAANVQFSHRNKYVVLVVGLLLAAMASKPLFALIYPPAVISRVLHAWVFGTTVTGMIALLLTIVCVEVFISPRWWCRTVCPGGALYGLIGWLRPLRVKLKKDLCTGCRDCIPVCEAGINPLTQSSSIECDNCGVCLRHCGHRALVFTVGLPHPVSSGKPARHRARVRSGVLQTSMILFLATALPAEAHHILGLPHYSYKENYPQRPTLEYPATAGPYEVLFTSYPGSPTPGEPANLAFYIKDPVANRVYDRPITVRVLQTSTFGDNTLIMPSASRTPFDNEYKFYVTFPDDGEYIVELTMDVEGRAEVVPFLMIAGAPSSVPSVVLAVVFGVLSLFVVVRAVQRKRRRRMRRLDAEALVTLEIAS